MSNSWKSVDEKISSDWSKHPLYEKVWRENVDNGCYGASSIFIDFVEELINKLKE